MHHQKWYCWFNLYQCLFSLNKSDFPCKIFLYYKTTLSHFTAEANNHSIKWRNSCLLCEIKPWEIWNKSWVIWRGFTGELEGQIMTSDFWAEGSRALKCPSCTVCYCFICVLRHRKWAIQGRYEYVTGHSKCVEIRLLFWPVFTLYVN